MPRLLDIAPVFNYVLHYLTKKERRQLAATNKNFYALVQDYTPPTVERIFSFLLTTQERTFLAARLQQQSPPLEKTRLFLKNKRATVPVLFHAELDDLVTADVATLRKALHQDRQSVAYTHPDPTVHFNDYLGRLAKRHAVTPQATRHALFMEILRVRHPEVNLQPTSAEIATLRELMKPGWPTRDFPSPLHGYPTLRMLQVAFILGLRPECLMPIFDGTTMTIKDLDPQILQNPEGQDPAYFTNHIPNAEGIVLHFFSFLKAAIQTDNLEMAQLCLYAGATLHALTYDGSQHPTTPPLAHVRSVKMAELLKKHGADFGVCVLYPEMLNNAILAGNVELVRFLLKNGLNPNQQDKVGNTPLHYLISSAPNPVGGCTIRFMTYLPSQAALKALLETKITYDDLLTLTDQSAPTFIRVKSEQEDGLYFVNIEGHALDVSAYKAVFDREFVTKDTVFTNDIEKKLSFKTQEEKQRLLVLADIFNTITPFELHQLMLMQVLIEHGADPSLKHQGGESALSFCVKQGNVERVKILLACKQPLTIDSALFNDAAKNLPMKHVALILQTYDKGQGCFFSGAAYEEKTQLELQNKEIITTLLNQKIQASSNTQALSLS